MQNAKLLERLLIIIISTSFIMPAPAFSEQKKKAGKQEALKTEAPEPVVEAPKLPPERAETARGKRLQQQIEQIDPQTKASWLGVNPDQFLALYRADSSGRTYANLILLHDNQQHPDWPGLVHQMRTQLAKQGWNTLSIAVPDMAASEILPALKPEITTQQTAETEANSSSAAQVDLDDLSDAEAVEYPMKKVPEKLAQRLQEALRFLTTQSNLPVFIAAIGSSATLLEQQSRLMASQTFSGAVLIDAAAIPKMDNEQIGEPQVTLLTLPVLDLVPQFNQRSNPALRKSEAAQRQRYHYQQRTIPGAGEGFEQFETVVIKAVRGWGKNVLRGEQNGF